MIQRIQGSLEIDCDRGVIYFHDNKGRTPLRICRLPKPIPLVTGERSLDVTHMYGADWGKGKGPSRDLLNRIMNVIKADGPLNLSGLHGRLRAIAKLIEAKR